MPKAARVAASVVRTFGSDIQAVVFLLGNLRSAYVWVFRRPVLWDGLVVPGTLWHVLCVVCCDDLKRASLCPLFGKDGQRLQRGD